MGVMLVRQGDFADVYGASEKPFFSGFVASMALVDGLSKIDPATGWQKIEEFLFRDFQAVDDRARGPAASLLWQAYAYLLLINTPKVVTQTQHDPHPRLSSAHSGGSEVVGHFSAASVDRNHFENWNDNHDR